MMPASDFRPASGRSRPESRSGPPAHLGNCSGIESSARKCQSMIDFQRTFDPDHLSRGTIRPDQRGLVHHHGVASVRGQGSK